jgi:hypothetical protein
MTTAEGVTAAGMAGQAAVRSKPAVSATKAVSAYGRMASAVLRRKRHRR